MKELINDLVCQECQAHGDDIAFPVFPLTEKKFGEICVECDEKIHYQKETK